MGLLEWSGIWKSEIANDLWETDLLTVNLFFNLVGIFFVQCKWEIVVGGTSRHLTLSLILRVESLIVLWEALVLFGIEVLIEIRGFVVLILNHHGHTLFRLFRFGVLRILVWVCVRLTLSLRLGLLLWATLLPILPTLLLPRRCSQLNLFGLGSWVLKSGLGLLFGQDLLWGLTFPVGTLT